MNSPVLFVSSKPVVIFSNKIQLVLFFIRNVKEIWTIYKSYIVKESLRKQRYDMLLKEGIIENPKSELDDPTVFSGSAMLYARKYNIRLCSGLARSQIKAYLPEEYWKQKHEGWGWGWVDRNNVCDAVCDCILSCKESGLL